MIAGGLQVAVTAFGNGLVVIGDDRQTQAVIAVVDASKTVLLVSSRWTEKNQFWM